MEDEEYAARHAGEKDINNDKDKPSSSPKKDIYKRIDITNMNEIHESTRGLDPDQRMVVNKAVEYIKSDRASENFGNKRPEPPLLIVRGGLEVEKVQ